MPKQTPSGKQRKSGGNKKKAPEAPNKRKNQNNRINKRSAALDRNYHPSRKGAGHSGHCRGPPDRWSAPSGPVNRSNYSWEASNRRKPVFGSIPIWMERLCTCPLGVSALITYKSSSEDGRNISIIFPLRLPSSLTRLPLVEMTAAVVLKPFGVPNKQHLEAIRILPVLETRPDTVHSVSRSARKSLIIYLSHTQTVVTD